jgi:hypothetical protein
MSNFVNQSNKSVYLQFKTTKKTIMTTKKAEATLAEPMNIWQKLHAAKQQIGQVAKNATNPHFKKSYADINALLTTVEPILHEHGLLLLQPVVGNDVVTRIIDIDSGEVIESFMSLPVITDPQKVLAAVTYFRRGTLQSLLSLQAVDDDGNTAAAAPQGKPTINAERFKSALEAIEAGKYTAEQLASNYALTEVQLKALAL